MIKAIENVKISSGYTTTIVNGRGKEFAKKSNFIEWCQTDKKKNYITLALVLLGFKMFY